jgi:ADP-ribose pyrophosphatase YjhB (NUDIX family)
MPLQPGQKDTRSRSVLGAGAVVIHEGRVLLVQVGYGRARGAWIFPGGYLDKGEDPKEAAVREVFEETAMHVEIEHPIAVRHRKLDEETVDHDVYWVFLAKLARESLVEPDARIKFQEEECLAAKFWPIEDALKSEEIRPLTRYFLSYAVGKPMDGPPPNFAGFVDAVYFF